MGKWCKTAIPLAPARALKVSFSHAVIAAHALEVGHYSSIAIAESDAYLLTTPQISSINLPRLISSEEWEIIRLGYRPFFIEDTRASLNKYVCPGHCLCSPS